MHEERAWISIGRHDESGMLNTGVAHAGPCEGSKQQSLLCTRAQDEKIT